MSDNLCDGECVHFSELQCSFEVIVYKELKTRTISYNL